MLGYRTSMLISNLGGKNKKKISYGLLAMVW